MPSRRLARRVNGQVFLVAAAVVLADEVTKLWARAALGVPHHLLGPLWLRLSFNAGVSFSFGAGEPAAWALVAVVVAVVLVALGTVAARGAPTWGFGLMIGGGVANLVDRLASSPHRVTDFVAVSGVTVFNLADACVSAGFVVLVSLALTGKALVSR